MNYAAYIYKTSLQNQINYNQQSFYDLFPFHGDLFTLKLNIKFSHEKSIGKYASAFKNHARSYAVEELGSKDLLIQLNISKPHVKDLLKNFLVKMNELKIQKTEVTFYRKIEDERNYVTVYFNSKTKIVTNDLDIDDGLGIAHQKISWKVQK